MSIFTNVKIKKPRRSKKNLSYLNIMTTRFGALTPCLCKEVYPNETWKITPSVLCRMTPLIAPLMSQMEIRTDYFFVPNRILWDDWETYITRGINGLDEITKPMIALRYVSPWNGSLADYLNFPSVKRPASDPLRNQELSRGRWSEEVDCLPFAAYFKIWDDWYRDENLDPLDQDFPEFPLSYNTMINLTQMEFCKLRWRGWKKDYFTGCLPWAQRGPELEMPIDIVGNGGLLGTLSGNTNPSTLFTNDSQAPQGSYDLQGVVGADTVVRLNLSDQYNAPLKHEHIISNQSVNSVNGNIAGLEGEGFTINEFRRLYKLQLWFERNARAGGRYIESILAHFGKRVPDYRLDRSEYIGGVTNTFNFGEVLQTSSNDESTGQALGAYAGRGISLLQGKIKKYRTDEHGWIFGILSIRPKRNAYFQGIPRQFQRKTALDYMFPLFTNLGEQEVLNKEIYLDDDSTVRDAPFGYNPRYSELYVSQDELHGEMRESLDFWHTARKFSSQPRLNRELVELLPTENLNRIFAYDDSSYPQADQSDNDHFILEVKQNVTAKRCLPRDPIPGL